MTELQASYSEAQAKAHVDRSETQKNHNKEKRSLELEVERLLGELDVSTTELQNLNEE